MMLHTRLFKLARAAVIALLPLLFGIETQAQPNPYRVVDGWAKLPEGRTWGGTGAVDVDRNGHVWVFERCGGTRCDDSKLDPILEFDQSGKLIKSFGAGMFVFPHGIGLDKDGNVYVTDADGNKEGKGHTVVKFSPEGKMLMTLGKPGVAGTGPDTFNRPSDVAVAPNGDIYVAGGHGGDSNARIVKFSKDGKFIKTWGKKGSGPGEFDEPHAIAIDSQGRVFVADRGNNVRIEIFDQDGKFITEWKHLGRASRLYIDAKDNLYVGDTLPNGKRVAGKKDGIWVASAKDGKVIAFIPEPGLTVDLSDSPEGVAADAMGNVYGAQTNSKNLRKYVKQ
jgi:DNA-binding beta-propeller fold protein YncE